MMAKLGIVRWRDYVMSRGDMFDDFWSRHGSESGRKILFIVGCGFDPRAPMGMKRLTRAVTACPIDVVALHFDDELASNSPEQDAAAEANLKAFWEAVGGRGTVAERTVKFRNEKSDSVADRSAANLFADASEFANCTDVVVDISAMPRVVYFPLLSRLIYFHDTLHDSGVGAPNVHVVVSEDPRADTLIREHGIEEEAKFIHPFEGPFNREAKGEQRTVWIPVMGEDRTHQFERMFVHVNPTEVCPVLPSPARNPRRGDDIVMQYQKLLFDEVRLEPRNIIYASETNPFDVYRQVRRTVLHYHRVLNLIGGCRVALSAMCSKVMSLGILLVGQCAGTTGGQVCNQGTFPTTVIQIYGTGPFDAVQANLCELEIAAIGWSEADLALLCSGCNLSGGTIPPACLACIAAIANGGAAVGWDGQRDVPAGFIKYRN